MPTQRISVEEYRQLAKEAKPGKYGNIPFEIDGHRFHSKGEAGRYCELRVLERCGLITDLELQPEFILTREPRTVYRADFSYREIDPDGVADRKRTVEDFKGFRTA